MNRISISLNRLCRLSYGSQHRSAHALVIAILTTLAAIPASAEEFSGRVTRVTDGDTFRMSGVELAIRVWGLDAPERDEQGGSAATSTMRSLVDGQTLTCLIRDIDRYQRLVGQCFLPDGRDITAAMISSGTATEYCRYSGGYYGTC